MSGIKRKLIFIFVAALILGGSYTMTSIMPKLSILNAYAAKISCSCHFISGRNIESIENQDLGKMPLKLASISIDSTNKMASASVFGLSKRRAAFKKGLGCVLIKGEDNVEYDFNRKSISVSDSLSWPYGNKQVEYKRVGFDKHKLAEALNSAFDEPGQYSKKTRALLVVQDDSIVGERYSDGFGPDTPILGWSMTKSITNILIGHLVMKGILDPDMDNLFKIWEADKRRKIKLDDLLRMSSGLAWDEEYSEITDATKMLFESENMSEYALKARQESTPGKLFEYSSGTSNILSALIRNCFDDHEAYLEFPDKSLFDPLGMSSAIIETDESGHFVCSSYGHASARDWAKLGLLFLHRGMWNNYKVFDSSWYDYSTKITEASPEDCYGAHIWLNSHYNDIPDGPEDMFKFSGYEGQYVYILPSQNMVIVRMGLTEAPGFDMNGVIKKILESRLEIVK